VGDEAMFTMLSVTIAANATIVLRNISVTPLYHHQSFNVRRTALLPYRKEFVAYLAKL
jgi:hypothetical protein